MSNKAKAQKAAKPEVTPEVPADETPQTDVNPVDAAAETPVDATAETPAEPAAEPEVTPAKARPLTEAEAVELALATGEAVRTPAEGVFTHSHSNAASFGVPKSQMVVTEGAQAVAAAYAAAGLKAELTANGNVRVDN